MALKAAEQRARDSGKPGVYDGATNIQIALTASVSRKTLQEAGFQMFHDALGRVVKADLTFALGKKIVTRGRSYRIDEIRDHPVNPEWVLGLKQL